MDAAKGMRIVGIYHQIWHGIPPTYSVRELGKDILKMIGWKMEAAA